MLSHEDERRLNAIERRMRADDPEFVRRFDRRTSTSMAARSALAAVVTAVLHALGVLGLLAVITGLLIASVPVVLSGITLVVLAGHQLRRVRQRRRR